MLKCGPEYANVLMLEVKNDFWHDVMKHYKYFCNKCCPVDTQGYLAENIFYNGNIIRDRRVIYIKKWMDVGVTQIMYLLNENGEWYTCDEFCRKYGVVCNFILYNGVLNAVRQYLLKNEVIILTQYQIIDPIVWLNISKGNKFVQDILNKPKFPSAAVTKWNTYFDNLDWKTIFLNRRKISTDPRLIWFQTRLIYRILPTNKYLFTCKIVSDAHCTFCKLENETMSFILVLWQNTDFLERFDI
jgi:hypothetical protein